MKILSRAIYLLGVICGIWALSIQAAFAQNPTSISKDGKSAIVRGINDETLNTLEPSSEFSFLIMGHIYGSPDFAPRIWDRSPLSPALPLLYTLKNLDQFNFDFVISLGDIVDQWREEELYVLDKIFLDKFDIPVFNAPGNHDLVQGQEVYQQRFGAISQFFIHGNSLFIILSSHHLNFDVFMTAINEAKDNPAVRNIFIAMHQPLFLAKDQKFLPILLNTNAREVFKRDIPFMIQFYPELESLSQEKQIFLMAGDVGAAEEWSYSIFYHREENIHFLANGLGDTVNDAILRVSVNSEGVEIVPVSLTGKEMHSIEHYGINFWKMYFSPIGEVYRKITANRKYLSAGFAAGIFFSGSLLVLLKIKQKQ